MKIAIAGYGVEGKANYRYWHQRGEVTIVDERPNVADLPSSVPTLLGENVLSQLDGFDLVVRTAGLAPSRIKTSGKIWSATNEFFAHCPAPVIGVTGTKGKGTTSSLIASILEASGRTVHLVGNIGTPALDVLPNISADDVVVYELSSFQLWDIKKSPYVAVVLMIEPDHLDVHADFEEYIDAKTGIARYQHVYDTIIYHADNQWSRDIADTSSAGNRIEYPYDLGELADSVKLPGRHNLDNAMAAVAAARQFTDDEKAIASGLEAFGGLPHRLKFVAEARGVKYYDDSIATTPGSARAAIEAFTEPKVIILGGSDKGADYTDIINLCLETDTRVIAIGQTGESIHELCANLGVDSIRVEGGMDEVIDTVSQVAEPGSAVILSPASASFDQYQNYADRGDQYIAAVNRLAKQPPDDR